MGHPPSYSRLCHPNHLITFKHEFWISGLSLSTRVWWNHLSVEEKLLTWNLTSEWSASNKPMQCCWVSKRRNVAELTVKVSHKMWSTFCLKNSLPLDRRLSYFTLNPWDVLHSERVSINFSPENTNLWYSIKLSGQFYFSR